jgi:DNA repair exonuclease SbcCD ATPase subunit
MMENHYSAFPPAKPQRNVDLTRARSAATRSTKMATRIDKTKATQEAVARVAKIADRQRQIAEILNAAAAKVTTLEVEVAMEAEALEAAIRRSGADARAIAAALAKNQVRVGHLSSRVTDALERRGQVVYPEPYAAIEMPWALVTNR